MFNDFLWSFSLVFVALFTALLGVQYCDRAASPFPHAKIQNILGNSKYFANYLPVFSQQLCFLFPYYNNKVKAHVKVDVRVGVRDDVRDYVRVSKYKNAQSPFK